MTDTSSAQQALRHGFGAFRTTREVVRASGEDTVTFLQGQLSQDVEAIELGGSRWSLLLEPQGRLVAHLRVWRRGDTEVLMDVDEGFGQLVVDRLNRFKLRVDTELELMSWPCVSLRGAQCPSPEAMAGTAELVAASTWSGVRGVDLLGPEVSVPAGAHESDRDAVESVRIEAGWPAMATELHPDPESSVIAAEVGASFVDEAASFTKGCYTGQELVARVDSRGSNTPRKMRGIVLGGGEPAPVGAEIIVEEQLRGSLSSVGSSIELDAPVALAFVHRSVELGADAVVRWTPAGSSVPLAVPAEVRELPLVGPAD